MFKCIKCGENKSMEAFTKNHNTKYGITYICKLCAKKIREVYSNTPSCHATNILNNIKRRCYDSNNNRYYRYGARGIKNSLTQKDIVMLWNRDGASLMKRPSIDRINTDGNYNIENCRFIESAENTARMCRKKVVQYDLFGNIVKVWSSIADAGRLGFDRTSISNCCTNRRQRKSHKGFIWKFQEVCV